MSAQSSPRVIAQDADSLHTFRHHAYVESVPTIHSSTNVCIFVMSLCSGNKTNTISFVFVPLLCFVSACSPSSLLPPLPSSLAWYYGMLLVVNLVFGVWGAISIDYKTTQAISDPSQSQTCTLINQFLTFFVLLLVMMKKKSRIFKQS